MSDVLFCYQPWWYPAKLHLISSFLQIVAVALQDHLLLQELVQAMAAPYTAL